MATRDLYRHTTVDEHVPYSTLAPIYDRIMSHVEYRSWYSLITQVLGRYSTAKRPSILEVGGGTGMLGRMLIDNGFSYRGSDLSKDMCVLARSRGLPFICADARRLPIKQIFDLVLFLYDGINYFRGPGDYAAFFTEAYRCLDKNGLLLFDVTTETNSMKHFYDFFDFEDFGDCTYVRHSYYEPTSHNQFNDFTIFIRAQDSDVYTKHIERHVQNVLSVNELKTMMPDGLFELVGVWDGFTTQRYNSRSDRIHFLYRKL